MITLPYVVLDTNIFISALIASGNCANILDLWSKKQFQLYISQSILNEIEAVGTRSVFRKYFTVEQLQILLRLIRSQSIIVSSSIVPSQYKSCDEKDDQAKQPISLPEM